MGYSKNGIVSEKLGEYAQLCCWETLQRSSNRQNKLDLFEEIKHFIRDCQLICCPVYILVARENKFNAIFVGRAQFNLGIFCEQRIAHIYDCVKLYAFFHDCPSVRVHQTCATPPDAEKGWTRNFWSKTVFLKQQQTQKDQIIKRLISSRTNFNVLLMCSISLHFEWFWFCPINSLPLNLLHTFCTLPAFYVKASIFFIK